MTDEQRRVAAKGRVRVCRSLWVAPLVVAARPPGNLLLSMVWFWNTISVYLRTQI